MSYEIDNRWRLLVPKNNLCSQIVLNWKLWFFYLAPKFWKSFLPQKVSIFESEGNIFLTGPKHKKQPTSLGSQWGNLASVLYSIFRVNRWRNLLEYRVNCVFQFNKMLHGLDVYLSLRFLHLDYLIIESYHLNSLT